MSKKKGLDLLRNLLLKEAAKESGKRSGIAQIGNVTRDIAEKKFQALVLGARKQGVDLDNYTEQELKYILQLNKPQKPKVISADSPEGKLFTQGMMDMLDKASGKNVIKANFGKPFVKEVESMQDIADARLIKDMYRTAGPRNLDEDAGYLAEFIAEDAGKIFDDLPVEQQRTFILRAKNALRKNVKKYKTEGLEQTAKVLKANQNRKLNTFKNLDDNKKLTDDEYQEFLDEIGGEDRLEAYEFDGTAGSAKRILKDDVEYEQSMFDEYRKDKLDPEDMAEGGRAGFRIGSIDKKRRAFLKLMGGAAAGIGALKAGALKMFGKGAAKKIATDVVTTPSVAGKPAWFDSLVNKVIAEGDDVTKKFATKDREIVHATKIDDDATAVVYRDLENGTVRVDIDDATTNVMDEQGNAIVSMEFKPGMADETTKGAKPADEFTAVETDYRNYMDGPDDFVTEGTENTVNNIKDLTADLTKVKMYAKGQKKPTIKEMMIQRDRSKTLKQAEENPAEYAADRGPDVDYSDYDNYASGGLAGMLGE